MLDEIYRIDRSTGTLPILLTLDAVGELLLTDLCRRLRLDRSTTVRALAVLLDLRLVAVRESGLFPFSRYVRLSLVGKRFLSLPLSSWPPFFFPEGEDPNRPRPLVPSQDTLAHSVEPRLEGAASGVDTPSPLSARFVPAAPRRSKQARPGAGV